MALVNLHDFLEDGADEARGDAEGRLVEHEEFWVAHEGAADGEHLLFAAGKRTGGLFQALFHARENAEDVLAIFGDQGFVGEEVSAHRQVFIDGKIGEDHAALGDVAEAAGDDLVRRERGDVLAEEFDFTGLSAKQTGNRAQRGGFACTVAADERDNRARGNRKRDAAQRADRAVADMEIGDGEHAQWCERAVWWSSPK